MSIYIYIRSIYVYIQWAIYTVCDNNSSFPVRGPHKCIHNTSIKKDEPLKKPLAVNMLLYIHYECLVHMLGFGVIGAALQFLQKARQLESNCFFCQFM